MGKRFRYYLSGEYRPFSSLSELAFFCCDKMSNCGYIEEAVVLRFGVGPVAIASAPPLSSGRCGCGSGNGCGR